MQAVQVVPREALDRLGWSEVEEPAGPGIEVAVHAVGLGWGDLQQADGAYVGGPSGPFVPGHEFSGVVVVGDGQWGVGDRVLGLLPQAGALAERVRVPGHLLQSVPDGLSDAEAAAAPSALYTAHAALHDVGRLSEGDVVVVTAAAGGVGRVALRLARRAGAATVVGVVGSEEKAERLVDEVDHACTYDEMDQVLASVPGDGADLVLESVGGSVFDRCVRRLRRGGRLVTYGAASGTAPGPLPMSRMWHLGLTVAGFHLADWMRADPTRYRSLTDASVRHLSGGLVEVAAVFSREDVGAAFEAVRSRAEGRVVINLTQPA